jgi:HAMP domain-containing protein/HPt (histidine-containing phosphotransfer) domain-containing protein
MPFSVLLNRVDRSARLLRPNLRLELDDFTGVTIKQRLMALIVASTLLIVGVLTWFFTSSQIAETGRNLRSKATTYSQLAAKQVMSAIAFSDRETAREVLSAIATDSDVASVLLLGADEDTLFLSGDSTWQATKGTAGSSRLVSVTPVVSLEGPKGTLVIELSTRPLQVARTHLLRIAIGTGAVALAVAAVLAWLIAGGIARRLRAIGRVATAVANGDLDQQPITDTGRDEVGGLASAFNTMVTQLKQLLDRIREMARLEQARLETLVAERTSELEARNTQMQLIFDQVEQGLLLVGLDGTMAADQSAAVARWLGPTPPSRNIVDFVRGFDPAESGWFEMAWASLGDDIMPLELAVTQLPRELDVGGRRLTWAFKPFEANGTQQLLVVISDVTADRARERAERDERETVSLLTRALRDRNGFDELRREIARLVEAIRNAGEISTGFTRDVHTLKGICGLVELGSLVSLCHELETELVDLDSRSVGKSREAIAARWHELGLRTAPFVDEAQHLDVREHDLVQLEAALGRGVPTGELLRLVAGWRDERARDRLERIAEQARSLADRLGKGPIDVSIDCTPDLRFGQALSPLWSALSHAVRNAIDHGIESASERAAANKAARPTLTLRALADASRVVVEVGDDGRGIHWERVAAAAAARGLPHTTHAELEAALFSEGMSTRSAVTEISGRGVGMPALLAATHEIGADLGLETSRGNGTTLRVVWPRHGFGSATVRAS